MPAGEKLASIFEPHTAILRRGKLATPTEFGRVVWLDEVDSGVISRSAVRAGNPDAATAFVPSLEHHLRQFGHAPTPMGGDGKVATVEHERTSQQGSVRRIMLPKPGRKTPAHRAYKQQRWFRRGRDWRAGIEGRITGLKRCHRLDRCRYHDSEGMER